MSLVFLKHKVSFRASIPHQIAIRSVREPLVFLNHKLSLGHG